MCEGSVHFINELMCVDTTIYPNVNAPGMVIYRGMATIDGNEPYSVPDSWPPCSRESPILRIAWLSLP